MITTVATPAGISAHYCFPPGEGSTYTAAKDNASPRKKIPPVSAHGTN